MSGNPVLGQVPCAGCGSTVDLRINRSGLAYARCDGAHALACRTLTTYGPIPTRHFVDQQPPPEDVEDAGELIDA